MRRAHDRAERDQEPDLAGRVARRRASRSTRSTACSAHADQRRRPPPGCRCARRRPCRRRRSTSTARSRPATARLAAASPPASPAPMPPPSLADRAAQQHRVGQRAQDVGHREPRRKRQLQPVDQDRRVEHADADAEHADAQHVQHQLPGRRLRQPHPHHRLDQHAHRRHAGHRGRRRLDVVGAVLAFGAVAVGDGGAEDARQHLPADEEAEREVHVRRGDAAQRPEHEDAERGQQQVVFPAALRRAARPSAAAPAWPGGRRWWCSCDEISLGWRRGAARGALLRRWTNPLPRPARADPRFSVEARFGACPIDIAAMSSLRSRPCVPGGHGAWCLAVTAGACLGMPAPGFRPGGRVTFFCWLKRKSPKRKSPTFAIYGVAARASMRLGASLSLST